MPWRELNQANWDERVPTHVDSDFYDIPGFLAGADPLRDFERAELPDVADRELLHLQCHLGLDTLAWARRGARVTGLDLSPRAVEAARGIAARAGFPDARFVAADVYEAREELDWRPVRRRVHRARRGVPAARHHPLGGYVASLLTDGGVLYLAEFHPITEVLDVEERRG